MVDENLAANILQLRSLPCLPMTPTMLQITSVAGVASGLPSADLTIVTYQTMSITVCTLEQSQPLPGGASDATCAGATCAGAACRASGGAAEGRQQ